MLSEDEGEAIERLKAQLNFWKKQNIKNSDCEIILNLITKLLKENETTCKLNANMSKRHLNDIFKIKNYEKQIDLMAERLRFDEELKFEVCKDCEPLKEELCGEPTKTQYQPTELKCVKQYFEKLVKEKG